MATFEFRLPDIGEGIAEAEIVAWHVKVGDRVEEDQQLADMMTDKATVEMESPVAGKVLKLAGEVGEQIPIGSILAVIETDGVVAAPEFENEVPLADGSIDPTPEQEAAIPVTTVSEESPPPASGRGPEGGHVATAPQTTVPPPAPPASGRGDKALASPAVRQRARDLGIDLGQVKSKDGRIRHADLDAYLLYSGGSVSARGSVAARQDETVKVVGLRRKIAENMAEANRRIQHFTLVEEFDVTSLEEARQMMNRDRGDNPKLTLLPFLITAMSRALADFPMLNATFDDEAMVVTRHGSVHMGVATQTPNGLMVATIRDAQSKIGLAVGIGNRPPVRGSPNRKGHARGTERRDLHHFQPRTDGRHHFDARRQSAPGRDYRRQQDRGKARPDRRRDRGPQADEPVAILRPPRRRRLGCGELPAGDEAADRKPATAAVLVRPDIGDRFFTVTL